jgi:hypothetical protein
MVVEDLPARHREVEPATQGARSLPTERETIEACGGCSPAANGTHPRAVQWRSDDDPYLDVLRRPTSWSAWRVACALSADQTTEVVGEAR